MVAELHILIDNHFNYVELMTYLRTLSQDESNTIWTQMGSSWGVGINGHYWIPNGEYAKHYIEYDINDSNHDAIDQAIKNVLKSRGIEIVWELREVPPDREIELSLVTFKYDYDCLEGYWTSAPMDWTVYASHEGIVIVAGDWLVSSLITNTNIPPRGSMRLLPNI